MGGEDCDDTLSDEEQPRPSTPITLDDTDIGLNESTSRPITQARQRATRYLNVRVLPRHSTQRSPCVPTVQQLQLNALRVYKLNRRRNRNRSTTATESARSRNILSSGQLSDEQRAVVSQMEFHVLKDILCVNPWPELEAREEYLSGAEHYATRLTGISGDDVFSQRFFNTVSSFKHFSPYEFSRFLFISYRYSPGCPATVATRSQRSRAWSSMNSGFRRATSR